MITELTTINEMLSAVGLGTVTESNTQHPSYKKALTKLQKISNEVQLKGYWFNQSTVTLTADVDGSVMLPQYTLHFDPINEIDKSLIQRGFKVYDKENRTETIARSVEAIIVEELPFELLPQSVKAYVAATAVHAFYLDQGGQEPKLSTYEKARLAAWVNFKAEVLKNKRPVQPRWTSTYSPRPNRVLR